MRPYWDESGDRGGAASRLRMIGVFGVLGFAVTLALIVGSRLSDEALAVLAGAVCGVGAAIPTSLLVFAVGRRRDETRARATAPQGNYPPVVVVTPQTGQQRMAGWDALPPSALAPAQRQFTVVGGSQTDPIDVEVKSHERY